MRTFRLGWVSILVLLLAACDRQATPSDGQIVAEVNGSEISVHQVQAVLQRQPALASQLGEAANQKVLDSLVEQELAAQAARDLKLDKSPRVLQAMELAKREVLAREYQDRLSDKAPLPETRDIDHYYDEHPELFKNRRRYTIQEFAVTAKPEEAAALGDKVKAATTVAEVAALVEASGLPSKQREMVEWSENLPSGLLKQFAVLEPGHSLVLERSDGVVIGTLVRTEPGSVNRREAERAIQAVLTNQRRRDAVAQGMDVLRQGAKIKLLGNFAASAASVPAKGASAP